MAYTLRYKHGPAMAVAELSALAFVETAEPVLADIEDQTRRHHDRNLLVNLLDVVGTLTDDDHLAIARIAVQRLSHLQKVATLVPEGKVAGEPAPAAGGTQWRVFTNLTEAVSWLLE